MAAPAISIRNLDHLWFGRRTLPGTGHCLHDRCLAPQNPRLSRSHMVKPLVAMIVNGPRLSQQHSCTCSRNFANKPVERLIGPGSVLMTSMMMCSVAVSDASLRPDVSALYQVMAAQVVERLGLASTAVHLDITSFHVDGACDCADGDLVGKLQLVRGYSRDHRPELNQAILELICRKSGRPTCLYAGPERQ